ncbi:MAG: glycoside hydrolase family 16 protein [Lachnospiraceae bacterium]|nr:glycoside hydrolase family 16 protein [Lachnospiraceae bacterium]
MIIDNISAIIYAMIFALNAVCCNYPAATETLSFAGNEYTLAVNDDFDVFDAGMWARVPEMERQDAGGCWRDSCSTVMDGNLVITCTVDDDGIPISGGVRSTKAYEQTYGLYHIRFKTDNADGLWYAFWLLTDRMEEGSVGNGAVDGAEIDIFEYVPHADEFCTSVHWDGYDENLKSKCVVYNPGSSFCDSYHDLWFLWEETGYKVYLDGCGEANLIFDLPGDKYGDGTCSVPCDMIISAEFGSWGGDFVASQMPAHFYIDCIQIYKR